jgi:peptidoglycan pentaglycine glycine transferase (the first glycine)
MAERKNRPCLEGNTLIESVQDKNLAEYEAFVAASPEGHFMQSRTWGQVKNNWRWEGLISRGEDGKIRGTMGILIRKVPYLPWTLMYAGRAPVCDIHDRETLAELVDAARKLGKKYKSYVLKMDPDVLSGDTAFSEAMEALGFRNAQGGKNFEEIQPKYVFRLALNGRGEDELLASFEQKTRYNIRLAVRRGVKVRVCGEEMLDDFSRIMNETGARDGFIVRPRSYFKRMLDCLGEHARLYMAFYEDKPIAGTLAIAYGDKVWYLYGASSNEYRNVMPNYLLQWEMIRWAVERSAAVYDFRGVSGDLSEDNPLYGLYRFKRGFNGEFCEFIGELNLVFSPAAYQIVEKGQHIYRRLRRLRYVHKMRAERDTRQDTAV